MSRELLLARVGDQLHVIGQDRERAANILLQWVVARLKFDQSIRIKGIGVFQLKKEPLPRVDRKSSVSDAPINKRTLVYSPQQEKKSTNSDPVFTSFDLDELNINSSDYLDKVFSLNVDKPLIPIKDDSSNGFESKVFGEDAEDSIEEKIEALIKDGEMLEDFNIFENYLDSEMQDTTADDLGEDDLVKEQLLQSMEDDIPDDIQAPLGSNDIEELNNINLSGGSVIEDETTLEPDDPSTDIIDDDLPEASDQQDMDNIDTSDLDDLNIEEEENIETLDDADVLNLQDDADSNSSNAAEEVNLDVVLDETELDVKSLEDPKLEISGDQGELNSDMELESEDYENKLSDSDFIDDTEFKEDAHSDETKVDELPGITDTGDIELVEELNVSSEDETIGEADFTEDKLDSPEPDKPDPLSEQTEHPSDNDITIEQSRVSDDIEATPHDNEKGAKGDMFAKLEDYLKEDGGDEQQPDSSSDSIVEKNEDLNLTDEFDEDLTSVYKPAKKKISGLTVGIVVTIVVIIVAGALSVYVFDFWGSDKTVEDVPPPPVENESETGQEIESNLGSEITLAGEVQEEADETAGLYREIKNDNQITNQIFFDGSVYSVQVSSWKNKIIAEKEVVRLRKENFDAFIYSKYIESKNGTWNRVRIGYFNTQKEAENFIRKNKF